MKFDEKEQNYNENSFSKIHDENYENPSSSLSNHVDNSTMLNDNYINENEISNNNYNENMNPLLYEFDRKIAYSKVSKAALLFLLYTLIFGIIFSFLNDEGLYNLFVIAISLIMIYFYIGKDKKEQMIIKHKKMSFGDLLFFIGLMYAINFIFSFLTTFIVDIVGLPSIDVTKEIAMSSNLILHIYATFMGPLFEEIQYRGFYLNHVRKYGIQAAIIISTITFCFAHLNIIQSIGTIGIGLVISYVAYVYSFKIAVLIHIINNAIAFGLSDQIIVNENSIIVTIIGFIILSLIIYSLVKLIFGKKYKEIYDVLKYKDNEKENFHALFKNGWFIAYIIITLLLSVASGFLA